MPHAQDVALLTLVETGEQIQPTDEERLIEQGLLKRVEVVVPSDEGGKLLLLSRARQEVSYPLFLNQAGCIVGIVMNTVSSIPVYPKAVWDQRDKRFVVNCATGPFMKAEKLTPLNTLAQKHADLFA